MDNRKNDFIVDAFAHQGLSCGGALKTNTPNNANDVRALIANSKNMALRTVVAGAIGEGLETFDFLVFGIFAVYISHAFFPTRVATLSLLLTVATLGIGFVTRPLGAIFFGVYADRFGRKKGLTLTMWLMGLATVTIALLPAYNSIGMAAPILLVIARLLQGFASGGEVGSAALLMMEAVPNERRGRAMSWQITAHSIASIAAGAIGFALTSFLSHADMEAWGWRVPFGLGFLIVPAGIYIRSGIDETLALTSQRHSIRETIFRLVNWKLAGLIILTVLFIGGAAVNQYLFIYMATFALTALKLPASVAMLAPVFVGLFGAPAAILGGWCADRFGRAAINVIPRVLLILLAYPAFYVINASGKGWVFLTMISVLTVFHMSCTALLNMVLAEAFPVGIRALAVSTIYALGLTIFGGTAQFAATSLIAITGDPRSIAGVFIGATTLSLFTFCMIFRRQPAQGLPKPRVA
jgi:MFS family permease